MEPSDWIHFGFRSIRLNLEGVGRPKGWGCLHRLVHRLSPRQPWLELRWIDIGFLMERQEIQTHRPQNLEIQSWSWCPRRNQAPKICLLGNHRILLDLRIQQGARERVLPMEFGQARCPCRQGQDRCRIVFDYLYILFRGVLFPTWDEGLGVLYIVGRGDSSIRYWEYQDGKLHYLNAFNSNAPGKGYSFFPKRSVDVLRCEVMRCAKLADKTVEYISIVAPRKSQNFQEDLFPEAPGADAALVIILWENF